VRDGVSGSVITHSCRARGGVNGCVIKSGVSDGVIPHSDNEKMV